MSDTEEIGWRMMDEERKKEKVRKKDKIINVVNNCLICDPHISHEETSVCFA